MLCSDLILLQQNHAKFLPQQSVEVLDYYKHRQTPCPGGAKLASGALYTTHNVVAICIICMCILHIFLLPACVFQRDDEAELRCPIQLQVEDSDKGMTLLIIYWLRI